MQNALREEPPGEFLSGGGSTVRGLMLLCCHKPYRGL